MMDTASAGGPADPVAERARPVAGQPGQPHQRRPTPTGRPSTATGGPNIGAATAADQVGQGAAHRRAQLAALVRVRGPERAQRRCRSGGSVAPSAWGSQGVRWTLEWALGPNPADDDFQTISTGKGAKSGLLGVLDLSRIRRQYAAKSPGSTLPPDGPEQYTVTLRLRALDGNGLKAEDRRTFNARHDPDLLPGYPKDIGSEMAPRPPMPTSTAATSSTSSSAPTTGRSTRCGRTGARCRASRSARGRSRSIDPGEPRELSGRVLQERRQASQRARSGQRHRRRRPGPRRGSSGRDDGERLGLRLGAEWQAAQGLPSPLPVEVRVAACAHAPVRERPQPPAVTWQLVAAGARRPPGERQAGHPHVRVRRVRLRLAAERSAGARVAGSGPAASRRTSPAPARTTTYKTRS